MADRDQQQHGAATAAKEQAAKEQIARDQEARKKQTAQREAVMSGKPTPTQEENDQAKLGVPFESHEPDGSPPDPNDLQTPNTRQAEAQHGNRPYQTRQSTAQQQPKPQP